MVYPGLAGQALITLNIRTDRLFHRVDLDQMPKNAWSDQVCTVCHTYSNILETSSGGRMDYFKFSEKYGK